MTSQRVCFVVLAQLVLASLVVAGGLVDSKDPGDPQSINRSNSSGKKNYWICRRLNDPADKDAKGNYALAISIYKEGSKTKAKIWQYDRVMTGAYQARAGGFRQCECQVIKPGDAATIKIEQLRFVEVGSGTVVGYATQFKGGKGHDKGGGNSHFKEPPHTRLIFRYDPSFLASATKGPKQDSKKEAVHEPCDGPPNDDVLEEEPVPPPSMPDDPPPITYEP